jgi:ubiquinone biosynthesis monooxygenase Coq7
MYPNKKALLDRIIRVDHAGEYGAKRIYEGQLAILDDPLIEEMRDQELEHLAYFTKKIEEDDVRPTVFLPLWHVGGFVLGAGSALLGRKAAMACTVAVEDEIESHYKNQLDKLDTLDNSDLDLKNNIAKFRDEEIEHKNHGLENNAEDMRFYKPFYKFVRGTTKTAIWLSERF